MNHFAGDNIAAFAGAGNTIVTVEGTGSRVTLWDGDADQSSFDASSLYGSVIRRSTLSANVTQTYVYWETPPTPPHTALHSHQHSVK